MLEADHLINEPRGLEQVGVIPGSVVPPVGKRSHFVDFLEDCTPSFLDLVHVHVLALPDAGARARREGRYQDRDTLAPVLEREGKGLAYPGPRRVDRALVVLQKHALAVRLF